VLGTGFFAARGLSALAVLNFRSAKNEGMLYYEASCAGRSRKTNNILCTVWLALSAILMLYFQKTAAAAVILTSVCCFAWYRYKSYREFGGISGDTSGWFVTVCETAMTAAAAAASVYMNAG
jgi:adenosylcobinamide-GDP ribazoletransferase